MAPTFSVMIGIMGANDQMLVEVCRVRNLREEAMWWWCNGLGGWGVCRGFFGGGRAA